MKKSDQIIPAYDTGIYRDPPKRYVNPTDPVAYRALTEREDQEIFNLDAWLSNTREFAQAIIHRYEDRSGYEKWEQYKRLWEQDKERAKKLPPKEGAILRFGHPLAPSKSKGIPENVGRQLKYAQKLRDNIHRVEQALTKEDSQEAALYGFLMGQYYEALRVCQVEHVAMRGRKVGKGAHDGGKARAIKPEIVAAWKARAVELREEFRRKGSKISDLKVAEIIESEFRGTDFAGPVETVRKKI